MDRQNSYFDVAICGAGLAGLSLARQLRLEQPALSIALLDRQSSPLPEAAWKVGESTVEFGAHYLTDYLQLADYMQQSHLKKLGLRFFFGNSGGDHHLRPEIGLSDFASVNAYQIDRGRLENDLRSLVRDDGVVLMESCHVTSLEIAAGSESHRIFYTDQHGHEQQELQCRWLIDASGRRQLIQRQLGLRRPAKGYPCSAAWFRLQGRVDVDDLVPSGQADWHQRAPGSIRFYSTNHLCGPGYWVWLIPLSSGVTSIGIVSREDTHPFEEYRTYSKALAWLTRHEHALAERIGDQQPLDFLALKQYSYTSERIFSKDRWCCIGEASIFADPFYSPGTDFIALTNIFSAQLIRRDMAGESEDNQAEIYSRYMIELNNRLTQNIQTAYRYLGDEIVSLARGLWDYSAAWGQMCLPLFNRVFTDGEKQAALRQSNSSSFLTLANYMKAFLEQWIDIRERQGGQLTFDFFDYLAVPWLSTFRLANLKKYDSLTGLTAQFKGNHQAYQDLVQALFLLAVEDLYPERLDDFAQAVQFDVLHMDLDPASWDKNRIITAESDSTGSFRKIYREIRTQMKRVTHNNEAGNDGQQRHQKP